MLEYNTKHFPLNLQSGSTLLKLRNFGVLGFEPPPTPPSVRHCVRPCRFTPYHKIIFNKPLTAPHEEVILEKSLYIYILKVFRSYAFIMCFLCFNIVKIVTVRKGGPQIFIMCSFVRFL